MSSKLKIYTKKGDLGKTSIYGGEVVEKYSPRIEAYGNVDELNCQIGVVVSLNPDSEILKKLIRIQNELMVLGSDLANPINSKLKTTRINNSYIKRLEAEIDNWTAKLPQLKNFILPNGNSVSANIHLARSICRRAERAIVNLNQNEPINQNDLIFINRLSDWLFTIARYVNHKAKIKETLWRARRS